MTDIDLDKLEALAEAAPQGQWMVEVGEHSLWVGQPKANAPKVGEIVVTLDYGPDYTLDYCARQEAKAAFIAAANPTTIKSLIASAREAAAEIEEVRRLLAESVDLTSLCTTPDRFGEAGSGEVFLRMTAHNAIARAFLARPSNPPQPHKEEGG